MSELADLVSRETGVDRETAAKAAGIMLALVRDEGDQALVAELMEKMPEAQALAETHGKAGGGGLLARLGGALGGGAVATYGKLAALGLDTDQIRAIAEVVFAHARERAGEDLVARVVKSIPGLAQFV